MGTTRLYFFNNTKRPTSNQILIFLQPVDPKENYLFSAWNVLNPSIGSTQHADLTNDFSGSIATFGDSRGNYNMPVGLTLGKALEITNPNDQSPVIGLPVHDIAKELVGLYNNAKTPPTALSVRWYVNGNLVVETDNTDTTTLNPGFNSTFQLKQAVYLMLGQKPTVTETYTLQTFSKTQEFAVPNTATEMHFEVYTDETGVDRFKQTDAKTFAAFVAKAVEASHQRRPSVGQYS